MDISVIICTRDRAGQLGTVLSTACDLRIPEGLRWELVLVDNGSADRTRAVVESFSDRLPIRYVLEPRPGLSNARNAGVARAQGRYICWTDDDVRIDRDWLRAYSDAFSRHPLASFFAGRVTPVFESTPPGWFTDNYRVLSALIAARDFGPTERPLERREHPYGANFAVRAEDQKRHAYNPDLGVGPGQRRLGEEVDVLEALAREGKSGMWIPAARVEHLIPGTRLNLGYVGAYMRSAGETWAYLSATGGGDFMGGLAPPGGRRWRGAPLWVWRRALRSGLRYPFARAFRPSSVWLEHWMKFHHARGAIGFWSRRAGA